MRCTLEAASGCARSRSGNPEAYETQGGRSQEKAVTQTAQHARTQAAYRHCMRGNTPERRSNTAATHGRVCVRTKLTIPKIASAPPGTQMATLDIESAFRNIPVRPAHKAFLVIQCREGEFYIDHVVCFGITSGVGLQGAIMDALMDILEKVEIGPNIKWVDDVSGFRIPLRQLDCGAYVYGHDIDDIFEVSKPLGVAWSGPKCVRHGYSGVYSGFFWELPCCCVSLPEEKRLRGRSSSTDHHLLVFSHGHWHSGRPNHEDTITTV